MERAGVVVVVFVSEPPRGHPGGGASFAISRRPAPSLENARRTPSAACGFGSFLWGVSFFFAGFFSSGSTAPRAAWQAHPCARVAAL